MYIGVKLDLSGAAHYGWIKLTVGAGGASVTIKEFAYNDIADASIEAGATVTGIEQRNERATTVYSYGRDVKVHVSSSKGGSVVVYDVLGKEIQSIRFDGRDTRFTVNGNKGVYLVKVTSGSNTTTRKVYIN